ncbi:hypothetical protein [Streptomyces sp. NPDC050388]|uniref:hypothetical protein n=1 Tax=Streptomyces sp. NPDC050388 TaxID=3155781 RepID=UPI00342FFB46
MVVSPADTMVRKLLFVPVPLHRDTTKNAEPLVPRHEPAVLRRLLRGPAAAGIVAVAGAALLPLGLGAPTLAALAGFALVGLLWPPYSAMSTTLFQRSTPPALLPQVFTVVFAVRALAVPLGTVLGGPAVAALGPTRGPGSEATHRQPLITGAAGRPCGLSTTESDEPRTAEGGYGSAEQRLMPVSPSPRSGSWLAMFRQAKSRRPCQ